MKIIKILFVFLCLFLLCNPASAWGFELFGIQIGDKKVQDIEFSDHGMHDISDILSVSSDESIDSVSWYLDGELKETVKNVRRFDFRFTDKIKSFKDSKGNLVGNKVGKDKFTGKHIHRITVKTEEGEHSWFVAR